MSTQPSPISALQALAATMHGENRAALERLIAACTQGGTADLCLHLEAGRLHVVSLGQ